MINYIKIFKSYWKYVLGRKVYNIKYIIMDVMDIISGIE